MSLTYFKGNNVNKERPVFLTLTQIRFPITAITSILHRASGFLMFLLIPFVLWMFQLSMTAHGYSALSEYLANPVVKFITWVLLSAILYHLVAGIRHLLMDWHIISDTLAGGQMSSKAVVVISTVLIILAGIWLW